MSKKIIFPHADGIAVITPDPDCGIEPRHIANRDVPVGIPYLIIDAAEVPEDRTFRAAWTADFSTPDGVGLGAFDADPN